MIPVAREKMKSKTSNVKPELSSEQHITAVLKERDVTREYPFTVPWLRKRRRLRLPPTFVRVDRMIFYRREAIEEFLHAHEVGS